MDINARLAISFYETVAIVDAARNIFIVQHRQTNKIYLKKVMVIYNRSVYEYLRQHPVPYTPRIYEIYEENHRLTVIEEYISGSSLDELLASGKKFEAAELTWILRSLCRIVSALHHCSPAIVHRDIKPSNLILTPSGHLYLLDFNAAKFRQPGQSEDTTFLGTRGYAAPEQYGFGASVIQTDIYAIGMLLNTLIQGDFSQQIVQGHPLTPLIQGCTKLDPSDRYESVDTILAQLDASGLTIPGTGSGNDAPQNTQDPQGYRDGSRSASASVPPCRTKNRFLKFLAVLLLNIIVSGLLLLLFGVVVSVGNS